MVKKLRIRSKNLKSDNKSSSSAKTSRKFSPKKILTSVKVWSVLLVVLGLGIFGYGGYYYYDRVFTNTERVFYDMVSKSLSTPSVSRTVVQTEGTRTETQDYFLTFSPEAVVQSRSTVEQIDQNRNKSVVTTESIGLKNSDFVRYTQIDLQDQEPDQYDQAIDQWGERKSGTEPGQTTQFLNEAIFTFIPFGNFSGTQHDEIMNAVRENEVYRFTQQPRIDYEDARPVMKATVSIKPRGLIEVLKKYNEFTGIGDASLLNPEQYDDSYSFSIQIKVDMISRHLMEVAYPGNNRIETYTAYGLTRTVELPTSARSLDELQDLLQQQ